MDEILTNLIEEETAKLSNIRNYKGDEATGTGETEIIVRM